MKNKYQAKYEEKILVWVPLEISQPCFRSSDMAVNRYVYRVEILESFLLPFKKYHLKDQYAFWPDQASFNYAHVVREWLISKEI